MVTELIEHLIICQHVKTSGCQITAMLKYKHAKMHIQFQMFNSKTLNVKT